MLITYNQNLKKLARENRKSGNLSEALLWMELKGKKFRELQFTRQKPILNYIVDFYCPKLKFVIEIDGSTHNDLNKDTQRQNEIESLGIKFIRFFDIDIKQNLNGVMLSLNLFVYELVKENQ